MTYKDPVGLSKTFYSIRNLQLPKDWEWVLVDSSPEINSALVALAGPAIPNFQYVPTKPEGIYAAMNSGIAAASGEKFLFLNGGDELVNSDSLFSLLQEMDASQSEILVAGVEIASDGEVYKKQIPSQSILVDLLGINHVCHQGVIYSRETFSVPYDLSYKLIADYEHLLRLYYSGAKISCSNKLLARFHAGGASDKVGEVFKESLRLHNQKIAASGILLFFLHLTLWLFYSLWIPFKRMLTRFPGGELLRKIYNRNRR